VSDVNRDGVVDLFVAADNEILWLKSTPELQLTLRQSIPVTDSNVIASMRTADITGDGNQELIVNVAYDGHRTDWYRYQNDAFMQRQTVDSAYVNGGGRSRTGIAAGDVNGDGIADIVYETGWKSYDAASGALTDETAVSPPHVEAVTSNTVLMDVDADGDVDIVSTYEKYDCPWPACGTWLAWHENVDGAGNFSTRHVVEQFKGRGAPLLDARDVDGDGDRDLVVVVSYGFDDQLHWLENEDGMGTFGPSQLVQDNVRQVSIGDLNGNGRADMLQYRNRVLELTFDIGSADPTDEPLIFDAAERSNDVLWNPLQDWNGDGKTDILAVMLEGQTDTGTIVWYENVTANGSSAAFAAAEAIIFLPSVRNVGFYDLNSDGLLDLLVHQKSGPLEWRQNLGNGQFLAAEQIAANYRADEVVDVDADGDLDIICAAFNQQATWLINNGQQEFETALANVNGRVVTYVDVDGDGDLDAIGSNLKWWENRLLGDSNGDGIFDSSDLVTVLQAGQYEDWIDGNSTFAAGDWNGDGDFTSGDLVLALQTGNYVAATRPRASDVAAAVDAMFTRHDDAKSLKLTTR
jgi:hypothetical protein